MGLNSQKFSALIPLRGLFTAPPRHSLQAVSALGLIAAVRFPTTSENQKNKSFPFFALRFPFFTIFAHTFKRTDGFYKRYSTIQLPVECTYRLCIVGYNLRNHRYIHCGTKNGFSLRWHHSRIVRRSWHCILHGSQPYSWGYDFCYSLRTRHRVE